MANSSHPAHIIGPGDTGRLRKNVPRGANSETSMSFVVFQVVEDDLVSERCFCSRIFHLTRSLALLPPSSYRLRQGTAAVEAKDLLTDQHALMSMGGMDNGPAAANTSGGNGKYPRKIVG